MYLSNPQPYKVNSMSIVTTLVATSPVYIVPWEVPFGNGRTIDIVATRNGKRIAFEIETGKSDAVVNVRKCLGARLDEVVVVATSTRVRNKLKDILTKHKTVELVSIAELLRRNQW